MQNKNQDVLEKAKNYAFLLLKFRPRSEKELSYRLKRKKFQEAVIKEVVSVLKESDFINDSSFAKGWISSKLKKPLGFIRIKEELKAKGVDSQIIEEQIQEIKKDYSEEDVVMDLARKRFKKIKGLKHLKAKNRVFAYLLRRGFSVDTVNDVLRRI